MTQQVYTGSDTAKTVLLNAIPANDTELYETKTEVEAARDGESSLLAKETAQDTATATAQTQADLGVTNAATAQTQADLGVTNAGIAQSEITAARDGYDSLLLKEQAQDTATGTAQSTATDVQNEVTAARKSEESLLAQINAILSSISGLVAGSGISISATDTTIGVMEDKLLAGNGISLTIGNAGGNETMTVAGSSLNVVDLGTVTTNTTIPVVALTVYKITVNADITISFSGFPSGRHITTMVALTDSGERTITWASAVKWVGGTTPEITANARNRFVFCSEDGGTTIDGGFIGGGFA